MKEDVSSGEKRSFDSVSAIASSGPPPAKIPKLVVNSVPNKILFAQCLPEDATHEVLTSLFQAYPGFQEVRTVPGKREIAFIEFGDAIQAGIALNQLQGFKLNSSAALNLTFGAQ